MLTYVRVLAALSEVLDLSDEDWTTLEATLGAPREAIGAVLDRAQDEVEAQAPQSEGSL